MLIVRLSYALAKPLTSITKCEPFKAFRHCEAGAKVYSSPNWLILNPPVL